MRYPNLGEMMTIQAKRWKNKPLVYFEDKVYKTVIPRNVRVSEAPSYGMPITIYDPKSKGARSYEKFAKEFLKLNEQEQKARMARQ